jgi:type I restriction enzyme S subunit
MNDVHDLVKFNKSIEGPYDIPESWVWTQIEVLNFKEKQMIPQKEFSYIDIGTIDNKKYKVKNINLVKPDEAPSRARKPVKEGYILYSTVRPYLKNMAIVPSLQNPVASTGFCVINTRRDITNQYLFFFLQSRLFTKNIQKKQSGASYPAVRDSDILDELIPLPPLKEQERIVAKLFKSFEVINKARNNINAAKKSLGKRHEILLRKAFKGELVPQISEEGTTEELLLKIKDKYNKYINHLKVEDYPYPIPENWNWVTLDSVSEIIMGQSPKGEDVLDDLSAIPLIGGAAELINNCIVPFKSTNNGNKFAKKDDIIFCVRATIGRPTFADRDYVIGRGVSAITPLINKKYIYWILMFISKDLEKISSGSTFKQITSLQLKNSYIPIPPLGEQLRIVNKLEVEFEKEKEIIKFIELVDKLLEKMYDSMIQRAFKGELVDQRPEEGIGLDLLEEIIKTKLEEDF